MSWTCNLFASKLYVSNIIKPKLREITLLYDMYYCSIYFLLSVNTFGIHNLNANNLFCYVYHEATARKTPNDVCSFLVHYINSFVEDDVEELHLFCDNCAGQNKNHALLRMIMALVEIKKFKKVQVFFSTERTLVFAV